MHYNPFEYIHSEKDILKPICFHLNSQDLYSLLQLLYFIHRIFVSKLISQLFRQMH